MSASSRQTSKAAKSQLKGPTVPGNKLSNSRVRKTQTREPKPNVAQAISTAQKALNTAVELIKIRIKTFEVSGGIRPRLAEFVEFLDDSIVELSELVYETTQATGTPLLVSLLRANLQIVKSEQDGDDPFGYRPIQVEVSVKALDKWKFVSDSEKRKIRKSMEQAKRLYVERPDHPIMGRMPARMKHLAGGRVPDQWELANTIDSHNEARNDDERALLCYLRNDDWKAARNLLNRIRKASFEVDSPSRQKTSELYEVIRDNWIFEDFRFGLCWFSPTAMVKFLSDWGMPKIESKNLEKFLQRDGLRMLRRPIIKESDYEKSIEIRN